MAEMDYAQEQSMWRAIGSCERACDDMDDTLERMQREIERVRRRDRLSFALMLIVGFLIGGMTIGARATGKVLAAQDKARFCMPGPYGLDPQPRGWRGGV